MKTTGLTSFQSSLQTPQPDRINMVAQEFESLFSSIMLKSMRNTIGESTLLPASMGEKIYTGMLDNEYAKLLGSNSSLGLADLIEKELRRYEGDGGNALDEVKMEAWMYDERLLGSGDRPTGMVSDGGIGPLSKRIEQWKELIAETSEKYGVDPSLVTAVVAQESGGNRFAVSRAGAKGLMQLMDGTAKRLGVTSLFDPRQNIDGGVRYLRQMLERFEGNEQLALAAYNAGPGAVDKYKGVPPYRETRQYVRSVLSMRSRFAAQQMEKTEVADRQEQL
jgi:hypothetical protein